MSHWRFGEKNVVTSWGNVNDDVVSLLYTSSIYRLCENVVYFKIYVFS